MLNFLLILELTQTIFKKCNNAYFSAHPDPILFSTMIHRIIIIMPIMH